MLNNDKQLPTKIGLQGLAPKNLKHVTDSSRTSFMIMISRMGYTV